MKMTDATRTTIQDSDLLWNTAHRISGQALVGFTREESQKMHALRKQMIQASLDLLRSLAIKDEESEPQQLAVVPPSKRAAPASGTTKRASAGAAAQADEPVKVE